MDPEGRRYFQTVAPHWDVMRTEFYRPEVRDEAVRWLQPPAGGAVLDLGAGTGFATQTLRERGLRVLALDGAPAMLDQLRRRWPDVGMLKADGERMPLPDASLDGVVAIMYLHHAERPLRAVAEAARVLRPGARLVVADLETHAHERLRREHHDLWMGFAPSQVRAWFEAAGLRSLHVGPGPSPCRCAGGGGELVVDIFLAVAQKP